MRLARAVLALLALGQACAPARPAGAIPTAGAFNEPADPALQGCRTYGAPRQVGRVPGALAELSGLAASWRHPGIYWAHNDSGNEPLLFALEPAAGVRATVRLLGARVRDVEAVAVGPCGPADARSCIWLGDIGNNLGRRRRELALLRLPEPERLEDTALAVEVLPFRYPDGHHDAESLVVDPRSAAPAVITKTFRSLGQVYALEGLGVGQVGRARLLGLLPAVAGGDARSTGADLHRSGGRLLVRTYGRVWEVRRPGARSLEELLAGRLVQVPQGDQPQAEAVAYLPDGRGYLLGTEGAALPLWQSDCE